MIYITGDTCNTLKHILRARDTEDAGGVVCEANNGAL